MKGQIVAVIAASAVVSAQKYPLMPRANSATAQYKTISYTTCSQEPDVTAYALEITTVTHCPTCAAGRSGPFSTVYTTVFPDVCACTMGMELKTYTITEPCSTPPSSTWSIPANRIPPCFTETTVMCSMCPSGPTPVAVTRPVSTPQVPAQTPAAPVPAAPAAPAAPAPAAPAPAAGCSGPGCPAPAPAAAPAAPSGAMPPAVTGNRGSNTTNITPNIQPAYHSECSSFSFNLSLSLVSVLVSLVSAGAFFL